MTCCYKWRNVLSPRECQQEICVKSVIHKDNNCHNKQISTPRSNRLSNSRTSQLSSYQSQSGIDWYFLFFLLVLLTEKCWICLYKVILFVRGSPTTSLILKGGQLQPAESNFQRKMLCSFFSTMRSRFSELGIRLIPLHWKLDKDSKKIVCVKPKTLLNRAFGTMCYIIVRTIWINTSSKKLSTIIRLSPFKFLE